MNRVAICVSDVVKDFEVYTRPLDLALEILTRRSRHTTFRALDGVSFEVPQGEVLGIIGANGAGKSTLLKIITGVLDATSGSVRISGRVTAILELGLGFNPEYSGRENIYLSGLLYGMDKAEIDRKLTSIIEFSGLEKFIEQPVKTYSSGMHSRLAFAIASSVDPDILIIDEALAAGDSGFVQKCLRRIRELCSGGRTVLLVSHGTGLLAQLCQRVLWLENGKCRMIGPALQVVQSYDLAAHQASDPTSWIEKIDDELGVRAEPRPSDERGGKSSFAALFNRDATPERQVFRRGPVLINSVNMINARGEITDRLTLLEPFSLRIHYRVEGPLPKNSLGVAVAFNNKADLSPVAQFMTQNIRPSETSETYHTAAGRQRPAMEGVMVVEFQYSPFCKGEYFLSVGLLPNEPASWEFYEYRHLYYSFSADDAGMGLGAPVWLDATVKHTPVALENVGRIYNL
jgi:ABC-type polysaccharide/polyol phosphate transport system ATPase subunit